MQTRDAELYQRVDEVLFYLWDPIGVSDLATGEPSVRDEYKSYVPQVYEATAQGKSKEYIASMLSRIEKKLMGLEPNQEHCAQVAELILGWAEYLKSK
jgi:hypothetical protein